MVMSNYRMNSTRGGAYTRARMKDGILFLMRRSCLELKSLMASKQDQRLESIFISQTVSVTFLIVDHSYYSIYCATSIIRFQK